jgi:hypothetical protein
MGYIMGSKLTGSSGIQTSVAGQEIIPSGKQLIKFALLNQGDCNISINGGDNVFFLAYQGVNLEPEDFIIYSVKIQQSGVEFNWVGVEK